MSNPSKKFKTDIGPVAIVSSDGEQDSGVKRKVAKKPAKSLLDLNVDALFAIFERLDVMDLPNVAQSCDYLKAIIFNTFNRKHKNLKLDFGGTRQEFASVDTAVLARQRAIRIFETFGSLIVELEIKFREDGHYKDPNNAFIIDSVVEHCTSLKALELHSFVIPDHMFWFARMEQLFKRLQKLHLQNVFIDEDDPFDFPNNEMTTQNGNTVAFFNSCTSLVESKLIDSDYFFYESIFRNSFPRLEHFIIEDPEYTSDNMDGFIIRHPNLKTISLNCDYRHVPVAAVNLPSLQKIGFQCDISPDATPSPITFESLTKFKNLKELTCFSVYHEDTMSALVKVLPKLGHSLEVLELYDVQGNGDFMRVLCAMEKLKILRFRNFEISGILIDDLNIRLELR